MLMPEDAEDGIEEGTEDVIDAADEIVSSLAGGGDVSGNSTTFGCCAAMGVKSAGGELGEVDDMVSVGSMRRREVRNGEIEERRWEESKSTTFSL
jgi:hypothetical protein